MCSRTLESLACSGISADERDAGDISSSGEASGNSRSLRGERFIETVTAGKFDFSSDDLDCRCGDRAAATISCTSRNIRSIRPGYGLAPKHLREVLGRRAARSLKRGEPLSLEDIVQ